MLFPFFDFCNNKIENLLLLIWLFCLIVVLKVYYFYFNSCYTYNMPLSPKSQRLFSHKSAQIFAVFFYFKSFDF